MKPIYIVVFFLLLGCNAKKEMVTSHSATVGLSAMTYNIRLDSASDGENAWPNRKDFLSSQIRFLKPDILGVQEARPNQIADLNLALPEYKFIGTGRDGINEGEFSAIYYNAEKIKVEEQHTFWLSLTPNTVSKGWDAAYPRICTYGLFSIIGKNQKFWVFNTHLDHVGTQARKEGMKLILKKIADLNTAGYPVLLMGDFNVEPTAEVYTEISESMLDSYSTAGLKFGPDGTFNGFNYHEPVTRRIDYIFVSKSPKVTVQKYAVLSSAIDFKFPSDHFPVFVELELKRLSNEDYK